MIDDVLAPASPGLATVESLLDGSAALVNDVSAKPYKGLESFQIEDADFFYGRDREAEQVLAKILCARLTVLHAQSGAGKTSLLNARIIPSLEANGWTAVRTIPQNDPIQAVTTTVLLHVLPAPLAERQALENCWVDLGFG